MNLPPIKYVQVQTHTRCNADCVFCPWIESEHAQVNATMSDGTWHLILDNLLPFADGINQGRFLPYLMQEPLIDKTIFAKINDIYTYFPTTTVEVSTNGAALTDSVIDKLLNSLRGRNHSIWISHHGINAETLYQIMQLDFDKAHANIFNLLTKSNGEFQIKIRGAGESRDGKHVFFTRQQYLDYWKRQLDSYGINSTNIDIESFTFHDRAATLHRLDRGANQLNMGTVRQIDPAHPFHCWRVNEWIHFMYDGRIRLCCMDYHGEVKLLTLKEISLVEYFNSPNYLELTDHLSGRKESPPDFICKRCTSPGG